ncbi:hypothetical protein [Rossellomorea aquimaris]|uniref:Uncharacterized protein n=1 Tax=Rossellomorea aquimaris TaxID=189382 RepID=A0A1J6W016_9BACI|nr:hypothetical protein [Rossellomorea aquimaris]OIU70941.1 hypothetical protein BHE18_20810 [Rossellomorea aquimaris]
MAYQLFNHIQGKNGSRWTQFIRNHGAENILVVAIDAAKYINKALLCNLYGDVYIRPFEFDSTMQGFKRLHHQIEAIKKEERCTAGSNHQVWAWHRFNTPVKKTIPTHAYYFPLSGQ